MNQAVPLTRRFAGPFRRLSGRRRPVVPVLGLAAALITAGCATKRDVRDLRSQVVELRLRQDSLFAQLERQNRMLLDSLHANNLLLLRARGDLARQLLQVEQHLLQVQELAGQGQQRMAELRDQLARRSEALGAGPVTPASGDTTGGGAGMQPGGAEVEQLYRAGSDQLQRGAAAVARQAFQQIVQEHSTHPLAPDAQFYLAETYVADGDYEAALREFERVLEMFPSSPRAPNALFRAGVISEDRGNISKAREYFQRVIAGYPTSDEAGPARERLRRLQS